MKILFAGSDEIAVPVLTYLASHNLVGAVLTTPDAPGRRGKSLLPPPVKARALELGLPVLQPEHLKKEAREDAAAQCCDTLLSFCYGKIFGPRFLSLFKRKFNIHPSMLPCYRGCAPLQAAILNQDDTCAISIQDIAPALDEGDIYITQSFRLDGTETITSLSEKVASLAPSLVEDLLMNIDVFKPRRQSEDGVSYTTFVKKDDARLDFTRSARALHSAVRAYEKWPKAYCLLDGQPLYLLGVYGSVFDIPDEQCAEAPGTVVSHEKGKGFRIATGNGYLYVSELQLPTKKAMDSAAFLNGRHDMISKVLT